jgi:hypothetical protein
MHINTATKGSIPSDRAQAPAATASAPASAELTLPRPPISTIINDPSKPPFPVEALDLKALSSAIETAAPLPLDTQVRNNAAFLDISKRQTIDTLLSSEPLGTYILRPSSQEGKFVVSISTPNCPRLAPQTHCLLEENAPESSILYGGAVHTDLDEALKSNTTMCKTSYKQQKTQLLLQEAENHETFHNIQDRTEIERLLLSDKHKPGTYIITPGQNEEKVIVSRLEAPPCAAKKVSHSILSVSSTSGRIENELNPGEQFRSLTNFIDSKSTQFKHPLIAEKKAPEKKEYPQHANLGELLESFNLQPEQRLSSLVLNGDTYTAKNNIFEPNHSYQTRSLPLALTDTPVGSHFVFESTFQDADIILLAVKVSDEEIKLFSIGLEPPSTGERNTRVQAEYYPVQVEYEHTYKLNT